MLCARIWMAMEQQAASVLSENTFAPAVEPLPPVPIPHGFTGESFEFFGILFDQLKKRRVFSPKAFSLGFQPLTIGDCCIGAVYQPRTFRAKSRNAKSRWCPSGVPAVSRWCPGRVLAVSRWCPGGVPAVSKWCPGGVPCNLLVVSRRSGVLL